jgi:hypothetical protein
VIRFSRVALATERKSRPSADHVGSSMGGVLIRQHWSVRYGSLIPGGVVICAAIATLPMHPTLDGTFGSAVLVALPTWLIIRSFRAGIECLDDMLIVRGWFWSRSIPRSSVTGVSRWRNILWTSRSGGARLTPLPMFWNLPNNAIFIDEFNNRAMERLDEWLDIDVPHPESRTHRH